MNLEDALVAFLQSLDTGQREYFHKHNHDADLEDQLMDLINTNQYYLYQAWAALDAGKVPEAELKEQVSSNPILEVPATVKPILNTSNADITMSFETFKKILDEAAQLKVDLALLQKKYDDLKDLHEREILKSEYCLEKVDSVNKRSQESQTELDSLILTTNDSETKLGLQKRDYGVCKLLSRLLADSVDTSSFLFAIHLLARISSHVKDLPRHREPLEDRSLIQAVVNVMNNNLDHYSIVHYGCSYLYRITENSSKAVDSLVTLDGMQCLDNCFRKNLKNEFNNLQASEAIMLILVTISNVAVYRERFVEEKMFNLLIYGLQFEDSLLIRLRSAFILVKLLAEGQTEWTAPTEYEKIVEMVNKEMRQWKTLNDFPCSEFKILHLFSLLRTDNKLCQQFGILLILNDLDNLGSLHAAALLRENWNSVLTEIRIQAEKQPKLWKMAQKLVFVLYDIMAKATTKMNK